MQKCFHFNHANFRVVKMFFFFSSYDFVFSFFLVGCQHWTAEFCAFWVGTAWSDVNSNWTFFLHFSSDDVYSFFSNLYSYTHRYEQWTLMSVFQSFPNLLTSFHVCVCVCIFEQVRLAWSVWMIYFENPWIYVRAAFLDVPFFLSIFRSAKAQKMRRFWTMIWRSINIKQRKRAR